MFVVFGLTPKFKDEGPVVDGHCRHCAAVSPWHLHSETRWLSLFLVSVLPLGTRNFLACHRCRNVLALSDSQNRLVRAGRSADDPVIKGWINAAQGIGPTSPGRAGPGSSGPSG